MAVVVILSCREMKSWNGTGQVYTYIGKIYTINDWFSEKLNGLFHIGALYRFNDEILGIFWYLKIDFFKIWS